MSTVASPGRLLAYIGAPPQPFIQRPALAGGFIQRLLAVPTPCRPLERAVPVPCQRASIAAQARARGRVVLGTSTGEAGPGRFRTGPNQHLPVLARWARPVWKTLEPRGANDGRLLRWAFD